VLGMRHAHAHQPSAILHRDLKPANVLLNDQYRGLVSDFGLAVGAAAGENDEVDIENATGTACGSLAYSPPEVLEAMTRNKNSKDAQGLPNLGNGWSEAGDVFSFGVLAWEISTAKVPYQASGHNARALFRDVVEDCKRPHGEVWDVSPGGIDPFVSDVIKRCWAQKKEDRPTFEELSEEFDRVAEMEGYERFQTADDVYDQLHQLVGAQKHLEYERDQSLFVSSGDYDAVDLTTSYLQGRTTAGTMMQMLEGGGEDDLSMSQLTTSQVKMIEGNENLTESLNFDDKYGVAAVAEEDRKELTSTFLKFYSGVFDNSPGNSDDGDDDDDDDDDDLDGRLSSV